MPDIFGMPDPLDDVLDPFNGLNRSRRRAAYPPLGEADAASLVGSLTDAGLSGLGYVGSVLDKSFGGRAVRGALGGHMDELASILPFSDSLGLTDPGRTVSGEDLLNSLGYHPERGTWAERNLAGPLAEVALDPATYLSFGASALSKAGKAAKMAGTLERGIGPGIRAGQRGLVRAGVPFTDLGRAIGTGARSAKVGDLLDVAGDRIKYAPGVRQVRSALDYAAGPSSDAAVQKAHEFVKLPAREAVQAESRLLEETLRQRLQPVLDAGAPHGEVSDYLRGAVELGQQSAARSRLAPLTPGLAPHAGTLDAIASELASFRDRTLAAEQGVGVGTKLLGDDWLDYFLRRSTASGEGGRVARQEFPTSGPSNSPRKKALRDIPGGTVQLERWAQDPALGALPDAARRQQMVDEMLLNTGAGPGGLPLAPQYLDRALPRKAQAADEFLAGLDPKYRGAAATPFFNRDILGDLRVRGSRSGDVTSSALAAFDVARQVARRGPAGAGEVSGLDFLRSAKLGGTRDSSRGALEHFLRAVGEDPQAVIARSGIPLALAPERVAQLENRALRRATQGFALPGSTAKEATAPMQRFGTPKEVGPFLDAYDKGMSWWKDLLYTLWPSSHARNLTSGLGENLAETRTLPGVVGEAARLRKGDAFDTGLREAAGVPFDVPNTEIIVPVSSAAEVTDRLREARRLGTGGRRLVFEHVDPSGTTRGAIGPATSRLAPAEQRDALLRVAYGQGVLKRGQGQFGRDMVREPIDLAEAAQASPSRPRTLAPADLPGLARHPIRSGQEVGQYVEDNLRLGQFLDLKRKGWADEAAAAAVERTHFDYSKVSDLERSVMKRLVPFYTFGSKNLRKQVRRAATEPGKVSAPVRLGTAAGRDGDGYVPEYLRSGFAVPLGESAPGTTTFLSKLGIPVEDAFGGLKVGTGPVDTLVKTLESAAGSTSPLLKLPLEALTGRQSFTGRKLSDLRPTSSGRLFGLLDEDSPNARLLTQGLANSPLSRVASTVDKMADERKPLSLRALNLLSGLRVSDVETERYRNIDARNRLDQLLEGVPGVSSYSKAYVRPEDKGKISPEVQALLQLQAVLAERAKAAAAAKRAQAAR